MGTVRIIGGDFRGRKLQFPNSEQLRPTSDRARETLFNWLQLDIYNSHCLDCYAGSGALGLEALSRGAQSCDFIESNRKSANHLKTLVNELNVNGHIYPMPFAQFTQKANSRYDIVFIDPPYQLDLWESTINALFTYQLVHENSLLYIEHDGSLQRSALRSLSIAKEKRIGQSTLLLTRIT